MVQVPDALPVTKPVLLSTEHTASVVLLYLTGSPELAVAETIAVLSSIFSAGGAPKLIVCGRASIAGPLSPQPARDTTANVVKMMPNPGI
jgi:hypothetical protein